VYRDHLLRAHGEVSRRGSDILLRLEERELALFWASVRRLQVSGPVCAARRREELGLPQVFDKEAERRLRDNRSRTAARQHRAAARSRGEATATLGALEVLGTVDNTRDQGVVAIEPEEQFLAQAESSRSELKEELVI